MLKHIKAINPLKTLKVQISFPLFQNYNPFELASYITLYERLSIKTT